jgi:phosphatidate cytidylyltransferase
MDSANAASAASQRNRSSLAQRLLSALVLIPLVVVLVWWNLWVLVVVVIGLIVVGLLELYGAFTQGGFQPRAGLGLAVAVGLALAVTLRQVGLGDFLPLVITLAVLASLVFELSRHSHEGALPAWALTLAGAFYISWLFSHLIMLRALDTPLAPVPLARLGLQPGAAWIYLVLAITWLQDSVAYFVGRAWGRHRMAPVLSPKKTWEGAIGGLVGAIAGGVASVLVFGLPISPLAGALLGLVGGIVGPLGDLAESLIKRQVGLKDAGHLIPGHGGILDRADSLLFTAPVLFYLISFLTR